MNDYDVSQTESHAALPAHPEARIADRAVAGNARRASQERRVCASRCSCRDSTSPTRSIRIASCRPRPAAHPIVRIPKSANLRAPAHRSALPSQGLEVSVHHSQARTGGCAGGGHVRSRIRLRAQAAARLFREPRPVDRRDRCARGNRRNRRAGRLDEVARALQLARSVALAGDRLRRAVRPSRVAPDLRHDRDRPRSHRLRLHVVVVLLRADRVAANGPAVRRRQRRADAVRPRHRVLRDRIESVAERRHARSWARRLLSGARHARARRASSVCETSGTRCSRSSSRRIRVISIRASICRRTGKPRI
ncbi:hypothetical protein BTL_2781 [Burkholderia thailandensis H0587]|nr:hypothetical protein BTL_2781 [Burkholderia thailandensis H0587]